MTDYFVRKKRHATIKHLEVLFRKLLDRNVRQGQQSRVSQDEFINLIEQVVSLFSSEPVCLRLKLDQPLVIVGDLFGQYTCLTSLLDHFGHPPNQRYLFLGNYGDRGRNSLEVICLLFAYKLKYPQHIYLLRGNHECAIVSCHYGLLAECVRRFSKDLWNSIMDVYNYLPAAAIVEEAIFCVHSGLLPCFQLTNVASQEQLRSWMTDMIRRPTSMIGSALLSHLTWSDPGVDSRGWRKNPAGLGFVYGEDVVDDFCERYKFALVIRSHDFVDRGYEFMANQKLLTIFTAPCFSVEFDNYGAVVYLKMNSKTQLMKGRLKLIQCTEKFSAASGHYKEVIIQDSLDGLPNDSWPNSRLVEEIKFETPLRAPTHFQI